jgi:hypothetical protein
MKNKLILIFMILLSSFTLLISLHKSGLKLRCSSTVTFGNIGSLNMASI